MYCLISDFQTSISSKCVSLLLQSAFKIVRISCAEGTTTRVALVGYRLFALLEIGCGDSMK